jgi:LytS/YehU family sensor histidine kinase
LQYKNTEIAMKNQQIRNMRIITAISIFSIILIFLIIFFVIKNRYRKNQLIEQKKQFKAIQKALSAQMNPHFISNSLNSIQNYFLNKDLLSATEYLNRFGSLIRIVLDKSMKEYISFDEEIDILRLYVQLESLRLDKEIKLSVIAPEELSLSNIFVPPLILQPIIENSIWHGISLIEETGKISIEVIPNNNSFVCIITDNGIGLQPAKSLTTNKKSYGLKLVSERIKMMSPEKELTEDIIIENYIIENKVAGTKVYLKFPLKYV